MKFNALIESEQIIEVIERLKVKNIRLQDDGCISMLDDEGNIWITPDKFDDTEASIEDIVMVDQEGEVEGKNAPSKYLELHREIYRTNIKVRAICHIFSPSFAIIGDEFNYGILTSLPNISKKIGTIAVEELGQPQDEEWIQSITNHFEGYRATIVFKGTGLLVSGPSLHNVFFKVENIEKIACTYIKSKPIGSSKRPNVDAVDMVQNYQPEGVVSLRGRKSFTDFSAYHKDLIELIETAYRNEWVTASSGSFSVRAEKDSFFINSNDLDRGYANVDNLVYVKKEKVEANKIPDRRIWVHKAIYDSNPKINAIAFVYPDSIGAFNISNVKDVKEEGLLASVQELDFATIFDAETLAGEVKTKKLGLLIDNDALVITAKNVEKVIGKIQSLTKQAEKELAG